MYFRRFAKSQSTKIGSSAPICAYMEYFGPAGDYEVWIDVVFLGYDGMIEENEVATYGPFDLAMAEELFTQGRYYCLNRVPLSQPGIYEFQLKVAGIYGTIISQRLYEEE